MFHNTIDGELPQSVPTLTEYIKEKGYFTSKFDGDWRCIYSYGFARGCDQYVYQIQSMGARAEHEIINAIEPILFPDITYSFYDVWADMLRIPYEQLPLSDDFSIVPSDYYKANGGVVFPNPNAPTGKLMPLDEIEDIIEHNQDVIGVVDEAYVDFGGESALPLIDKYDNVIVVQTFSKSRALAGSRVGFAMASPVLIKYLNDVKYSFNSYTMDRITIEAATAAVKDRAYFEETTAKVIKTREWTKKELKRLGFTFCDSKSNFIFAKPANVSATKLFEDLKADNIFVRHFSSPERINDYLRISIGTDEQMHTLIKFLENYSC